MNERRIFSLKKHYWIFLLTFIISLGGCLSSSDDSNESQEVINEETEIIRFEDWGEESHSKSADANYDIVFPQDQVNRIDLRISSENWDLMMDDMQNLYGNFASGGQGIIENDEDPIYVPCTLEFEGIEWWYVGIRFKGNSSLSSAWTSGNLKLPLRLDFDEFEDDYPIIDNQRFYGFKKLTLSSGFNDESLVREKVTADIFRESGLVSAQTAFYRVYINYGEEEKYMGLYTMVEDPDGPLLDEQFEYDDGNLYKPDGTGADFSEGSFDRDTFNKKTNDDEEDWSDILALFEVLHSENRTINKDIWRSELEAIFDVDVFLKWLAVNTVIQNWDTYGKMTHNYYLYNDKDGKLNWIPWDNNESLSGGDDRRFQNFSSPKTPLSLELSSNEVDNSWPLIRYLIDDEIYKQKYTNYVEEVISISFEPTKMKEKYAKMYNLIYEYTIGENGENEGFSYITSNSSFEDAFVYLNEHVDSRNQAALNFLELEK